MAEQIEFELVSPERLLLARPVEMVVVPGAEGDFGALPGHAPFVSVLRPGVIAVFDAGRVSERIFVAGGFAEVTAERCTVLAEEAVPIEEINVAALDQELKNLAEDLADAKTEAERVPILAAIAIGEAKRAAAKAA